MIKHQLFIGAALLVGVAVGYFCDKSSHVAPSPEADAKAGSAAAIVDNGAESSLKALRRRVAELERQLAERPSETVVTNVVRQGPPHGRLEDLKKTDPERYAMITNRMAAFRARRQERLQAKMAFLSSVDTSHMSGSAKKTHDALMQLTEQRAALEAELHKEGLTDDERRAIMEKLHDTGRKLRKLNETERDNLFNLTAETLGFQGDDAKEISSTMREIVEATDDGRRGFGEPPPPPPNGTLPPPSEGGVR